MNSAIESMLSRRSVRQFSGAPVGQEDIELMLRAGMAAPTGMNLQPWAFIIVTDRRRMDALREALPYAKMLDKAGAAIVVCGDGSAHHWVEDCSAAAENVLLAAHALGYGAVWTAAYPYEDRIAAVRKECAIPNAYLPLCVIPVGVPNDAAGTAKDKYKPGNIHRNVW